MSEEDPTVDEQIRDFEEKIGERVNPQNRALEAWRNAMLLMGKDPDNMEMPPEIAERIARDTDDGVPDWMKDEPVEEIEDGPKGRRKKPLKTVSDPWSGWDGGDVEYG